MRYQFQLLQIILLRIYLFVNNILQLQLTYQNKKDISNNNLKTSPYLHKTPFKKLHKITPTFTKMHPNKTNPTSPSSPSSPTPPTDPAIIKITNFPHQYLTPKHKKRILTGIRPFRKTGIRLQKQYIKDKIVIHNYGHGGAGVSLAPGTAVQAVSILQRQINKNKQQKNEKINVGILGCGIVGLMSAIQCIEKGYNVTIYSQRIPTLTPSSQLRNSSTMCTSQIAPGYWLPYHYQYPQQNPKQQQIHNTRSKISYEKYQKWMYKLVQKYKNQPLFYENIIREVPVYQDMDIEEIRSKAPQFIADTCRSVTLQLTNTNRDTNIKGTGLINKKYNLIYFQTIQIHLQNFLQQLIKQLHKTSPSSTKFTNIKFTSLQDILSLDQKYLINCLALTSRHIFHDNLLYGIKGHLIEYQNVTKIKGIFGFRYKEKPIKLYCFNDKILVGLTKQESSDMEVNWKLVEELERRVYEFCGSMFQDEKNGSVNKSTKIRPKL